MSPWAWDSTWARVFIAWGSSYPGYLSNVDVNNNGVVRLSNFSNYFVTCLIL